MNDESFIYWTCSDLEETIKAIGPVELVRILAKDYPKVFSALDYAFDCYPDCVNDIFLKALEHEE